MLVRKSILSPQQTIAWNNSIFAYCNGIICLSSNDSKFNYSQQSRRCTYKAAPFLVRLKNGTVRNSNLWHLILNWKVNTGPPKIRYGWATSGQSVAPWSSMMFSYRLGSLAATRRHNISCCAFQRYSALYTSSLLCSWQPYPNTGKRQAPCFVNLSSFVRCFHTQPRGCVSINPPPHNGARFELHSHRPLTYPTIPCFFTST